MTSPSVFNTHMQTALLIQAFLALMLPAPPQLTHWLQSVMEGCSARGGKLHHPPPAPGLSLLYHTGLHLITTSRTPQLKLWPTQLPPPWQLMCICRLCAPATPCWPTHTRHCSLTSGWVGDDYMSVLNWFNKWKTARVSIKMWLKNTKTIHYSFIHL